MAEAKPGEVFWKDKVQNTITYRDYLIEAPAFQDAVGIVYACTLDKGAYVVLKDAGLTAKMAHTFAGWPISAPLGPVTNPDPLAPATVVVGQALEALHA